MEDDGCFFSVAKSTKRMDLLELNERKNSPTVRVYWHQLGLEISLWRTSQRSVLLWKEWIHWVLPEAKGRKGLCLLSALTEVMGGVHSGAHSVHMLTFCTTPSILLVAVWLFFLSSKHIRKRGISKGGLRSNQHTLKSSFKNKVNVLWMSVFWLLFVKIACDMIIQLLTDV